MKPPVDFEKIIGRKHYSTRTAILIAGDDHWDGHNFERSGRNTFLYRTPNGAYFEITLSQWQGEVDQLNPLTLDYAVELYERLTEYRIPFCVAFPGTEVINA